MLKSIFIIVFYLFIYLLQAQDYFIIDSVSIVVSSPLYPASPNTALSTEWSLKINEFCAINESVVHDEFGEYDDWIELYNFGEDTVDLNGIYITDDISQPQKWQFDQPILIIPDSFTVIWADNQPEQGKNHVGFKLSGEGEEIALFTPENILLIDSVVFEQQTVDYSMGRQPDGGSIWNYFNEPTPGSSNSTTGLYGITPDPEFSVAGGFYEDDFLVELSVDLESAIIYYTLDCSEPTETSIMYITPILVDASTVIRARAFKEDWLAGPIATTTYLFDQEYSLDVISLVTQHDNFWGSSGIYQNYNLGVEKPIHFEYFTATGEPGFYIDLGVKIHSPDSRQQKSLRFYARSQYGENEINYKIFDDIDITTFKRLILRNGGNDGFELSKTQIRDPMAHIIYRQNNPENAISSYKPVNVFLNGQYWGMYNLRERQDKYYIESNFGEEEFDFLEYDAEEPGYKHAIEGDWQNFDSLKNYVITKDLSIDSYYQVVKDWMDIENFVDYQIFEIFIGNQDWLSNNIKFWRPGRPDGIWKWVLWDTEYGLALFYPNYPIGYPDFNFLHMALTWGGWGSGDYTYLLRNLADNQEFLEYFNIRFADLLNTELKENGNIIDVIDSLQNLLSPGVQYQFNRWGGSYSNWTTKIQEIKNFTNGRPYYIRQHIIDEFELNTLFTLSLNILPPGSGKIEVNTITINEFPWEGQYFTDYATVLNAVPNQGYVFTGWEGLGIDTAMLQIVAMGDTCLTAIFQSNPSDTTIIINEINYNSAAFFNSGDWVELKNIASLQINLSGWTFKDEEDDHIFELPDNLILDSDSFLVLCKDTQQFSTLFPGITDYTGNLEFGLSGSGEVLRLYDFTGELVDSVQYDDNYPWTNLPDGYGPSLELINDSLNNNLPESWRASFVIGGTPCKPNSVQSPVELFINEFMADNDTTIADPQGEFDDWIELFNDGEQYVNIGGMFITDDLDNPTIWQIPGTSPDSTIILPGEFLLLWADDDSDDGIYHLEIKLSASGEQIGIFAQDGLTVLDSLTFSAQSTDISFGRRFDGGTNWLFMNKPTPGESNTAEIIVSLKVFLEGAFNNTEMSTLLNPGNIPLAQPYNIEPWNYYGSEEVFNIPNQDITDWILIELRDAASSSMATQNTSIIQQAGFILKNGVITGIDGANDLRFNIYFNDSLYAVIRHRNHLGIMTMFALEENGGIFSYDLTGSVNQVYGGAQAIKEIAADIWGMISGDAYSDGEINIMDKDSVWLLQSGKSDYFQGDLNMDTQIDNMDKNDFWLPNVGHSIQVPQ
ncbi:MAG: CotH kinase family protein [Bacteroidales bacterium]|nr:CotH kinase family protein [Bacteroidales bacterium]